MLLSFSLSRAKIRIYRSAFERAWTYIFCGSPEADTLRTLFPDSGDHIEEYQFSKLHKIILGMTGYDREKDLKSIDRSELDVPDFRGNTALMWAIRRGDCNVASILTY